MPDVSPVSAVGEGMAATAQRLLVDCGGRKSFHYPLRARILVAALLPLLVLLPFIVPIKFSSLPFQGQSVLAGLLACLMVALFLCLLLVSRPALTVTGSGITVHRWPLGKDLVIPWQSFVSLTPIKAVRTGPSRGTVFKLAYQTSGAMTGELLCNGSVYEGGAELYPLLRQIVSEGHPTAAEPIVPNTSRLTYLGHQLTSDGIIPAREQLLIDWQSVYAVRSAATVIAGYGSLECDYRRGGQTVTLTLRATTSEAYRRCVTFLLHHTRHAAIDGGVRNILAYPLNAARADYLAVVLLVSGFLLGLGVLLIMAFYAPTIASTWTYPLLLIPFSLVPLAVTLKTLADRPAGKTASIRVKVGAACGANLGALLALLLMFGNSPASWFWMLADANALTGNTAVAENYYQRCEASLSGNSDFLFTLGQFNYRRREYGRAADYYLRAYELDPTNWIAAPLARIPECLNLAGRRGEALKWCDRIQADYAGRTDVIRMIERVRTELGG